MVACRPAAWVGLALAKGLSLSVATTTVDVLAVPGGPKRRIASSTVAGPLL